MRCAILIQANPLIERSKTENSIFAQSSMADSCAVLNEEEEVKVEQKPTLKCRQPFTVLPQLKDMDDKYQQVISALPKEEGWLAYVIRKYKGFWLSERYLPGIMAMQESFKVRPDDVVVASYMKSGTTWLKALTFSIVHRNKYAFSSHPLLNLNPHDCVPITEHHFSLRDEQYLETLPSPRVFGTHLPYSILPESIKTSECRIVYICREPKDVIVSLWHMVTKLEWFHETFPFTQAFELFCEGRMIYGPVWNHVLEYYKKCLECPNKILLLKYEDMMKDSIDGVIRIAKFIGCPFSEQEVKDGAVQEIVEFCSFNKLKSLDVNKNGIGDVKNDYFFRKALVGDWKNHMTAEMATKLDEITKKKLLDCGFTY